MSSFSAVLLDSSWSRLPTGRLTLIPVRYSAVVPGGFDTAEVSGVGDDFSLRDAYRYLMSRIQIENSNGTPVWRGFISSVEIVFAYCTIRLSTDNIRNRLRVDYSWMDSTGSPIDGVTPWTQTDWSVGKYGIREERLSVADITYDDAIRKQETWIKQTARLQPIVQTLGGDRRVFFEASGLWRCLEWRYYEDQSGRVVYDETDDEEHAIGWGLGPTASTIGFDTNSMGDLDCRLTHVFPGMGIRVSGSYNNDGGPYIVENPPDKDLVPLTYVSDGIDFDASDDIMDSNSGFDDLTVGNMITTSGTTHPENTGTWFITIKRSNNSIEVNQHSIVDETANGNVTIKQGHFITFDAANFNFAQTSASYSISLVSEGIKIAQSFQLPTADSWPAYEAMVRVRKVGTPADNVRVRLYSDTAGSPGTEIASGTYAGADVREVMEWITVSFASPVTLSPSTTYWLVVDRTGGLDPDNFYVSGLVKDTERLYSGGSLKIQRSSDLAWVTRWVDGDMPFQIWGKRETTEIIRDIVETCGEFLTGCQIDSASGVYERQYQDGKSRASDIIVDLLDRGDSSNQRLIATVDLEGRVRVKSEPTGPDTTSFRFRAGTGEFLLWSGSRPDLGVLPIGTYVVLDDLDEPGSLSEQLGRTFVNSASYDVESGEMSFEPYTRGFPWERE